MDSRRSAVSSQRRRRVLLEEPAVPEEDLAAEASPRRPRSGSKAPRSYSESALAIHQPRITDLLPERSWVLTLILTTLAMSIIGLGFVEANASRWESQLSEQAMSLLEPAKAGSLSRWSSSLMLGWAGLLSLIIFSLRRHKTNDYHARYRVWLVVAASFFLSSMNAATGMYHLVREGTHLLANHWFPNASWATKIGAGFGPLVTIVWFLILARLAIEIRRQRVALILLGLSAAGSLLVAALGAGWFSFGSQNLGEVITASLQLFTDWGLLAAVFVDGRHVYLDAQGLLRRAAKLKKKKEERLVADATAATATGESSSNSRGVEPEASPDSRSATTTVSNRRSDLDSEPRVGQGSSRKPPIDLRTSSKTADSSGSDDEDDQDSDSSGLSRSERRRLRKLAKREGRSAA